MRSVWIDPFLLLLLLHFFFIFNLSFCFALMHSSVRSHSSIGWMIVHSFIHPLTHLSIDPFFDSSIHCQVAMQFGISPVGVIPKRRTILGLLVPEQCMNESFQPIIQSENFIVIQWFIYCLFCLSSSHPLFQSERFPTIGLWCGTPRNSSTSNQTQGFSWHLQQTRLRASPATLVQKRSTSQSVWRESREQRFWEGMMTVQKETSGGVKGWRGGWGRGMPKEDMMEGTIMSSFFRNGVGSGRSALTRIMFLGGKTILTSRSSSGRLLSEGQGSKLRLLSVPSFVPSLSFLPLFSSSLDYVFHFSLPYTVI